MLHKGKIIIKLIIKATFFIASDIFYYPYILLQHTFHNGNKKACSMLLKGTNAWWILRYNDWRSRHGRIKANVAMSAFAAEQPSYAQI